jgi:hypothetical protein
MAKTLYLGFIWTIGTKRETFEKKEERILEDVVKPCSNNRSTVDNKQVSFED